MIQKIQPVSRIRPDQDRPKTPEERALEANLVIAAEVEFIETTTTTETKFRARLLTAASTTLWPPDLIVEPIEIDSDLRLIEANAGYGVLKNL